MKPSEEMKTKSSVPILVRFQLAIERAHWAVEDNPSLDEDTEVFRAIRPLIGELLGEEISDEAE